MKFFSPTTRGRHGLVAFVALVALVLTGCSVPETTAIFPTGGFAVDVPVLWVGTEADGAEVGGVEATQVWTGASDTSRFSVDVNGIEAEGAGDAWRAASASAAAVATLLSGTDPSSVDIRFHISSPIDGPSAGGILTVGILASLRHLSLKPRVTMTGTMSPDGSIGPVGGVLSKVAAAADAGYTTVLIPEANRTARDPETAGRVDVVAFGDSLGTTVVPVMQLAEAFSVLTGASLLGSGEKTATAFGNALTDLAPQRLANVNELLDETTQLATTSPNEETTSLVRETFAALDAGDLGAASGLARESYLSGWRQAGEAQTRATLTEGIPASVAALTIRVESALARGQSAITSTVDQSGLTDSQYASMPETLLGVVTAHATLEALKKTLSSARTEPEVIRAANILADQEAAIDVFFAFDNRLLNLTRGTMEIQSSDPIAFLSNYTNFLIQSGEANMTYLGSVLEATSALNQRSVASFDTTYPILVALETVAQAIPPRTESLPNELREATYALALYVNSAAMVSQAQALRIFTTGVGEAGDLGENLVATAASIASASASVTATVNQVTAEGWDPAYSLAQAQAGAAFATNQLAASSSTNSVSRGLLRLWAASVSVQLMQAAPR